MNFRLVMRKKGIFINVEFVKGLINNGRKIVEGKFNKNQLVEKAK